MLTDYIHDAIVGENIFPDSLKFGDITLMHKKMKQPIKKIIDQQVCYL